MPDSNKTVDAARKMLEDRRSELHGELTNIEQALSALGGRVASSAKSTTAKVTKRGRKPGRPPGRPAGRPAAKKATKTRRRRGRRGGTRSDQALKLITEKPDLTASQIAGELGIKPNYMYRVLGELEGEKKIKKSGRKYKATS